MVYRGNKKRILYLLASLLLILPLSACHRAQLLTQETAVTRAAPIRQVSGSLIARFSVSEPKERFSWQLQHQDSQNWRFELNGLFGIRLLKISCQAGFYTLESRKQRYSGTDLRFLLKKAELETELSFLAEAQWLRDYVVNPLPNDSLFSLEQRCGDWLIITRKTHQINLGPGGVKRYPQALKIQHITRDYQLWLNVQQRLALTKRGFRGY